VTATPTATKTKTATATTTATKTKTARCTRYPCDHAYQRRTHELEDGLTFHRVSVDYGSDLDDDGDLVTRWRVDVTATDNGSWAVSVYTRDEVLILTDPDEAIRFSGGVAQATPRPGRPGPVRGQARHL